LAQEERGDEIVCGVEFPTSWVPAAIFTGHYQMRTLTGPRGVAPCKRDLEAVCHTVENTRKDWDLSGSSLTAQKLC